MNLAKVALRPTALVLILFALAAGARGATVQRELDPNSLQIDTLGDCAGLRDQLEEGGSGGQWLIGSGIEIFGQLNGREPVHTLANSFDRVSCFSDQEFSGQERVFVATSDLSICGWVARQDLLDEHRNESLRDYIRRSEAVCETPRAMPFDDFCDVLSSYGDIAETTCTGLPLGLRAKGVLVGSTAETLTPFMTSPIGGEERQARNFFSILEIHDVALGSDGQIMVLVGDGEGDMFGWLDLDAIELWPTRLGLFYDEEGIGEMYQSIGDLVSNWRTGSPSPDIRPGISGPALSDYIHGGLPLLSYPIIRMIDPLTDPGAASPDDTPYYEVIFLGQTGEGSASQLIAQMDFSRRLEALQRLNVMLVVDTTESMRPYLPLVRDGLTRFIRDYARRSLDAANRVPEMRIAVWAYSDFEDEAETGLFDDIRMEELMPPMRICSTCDVEAALERISNHQGLDDPVGLREEAGLEAVAQLSHEFESDRRWFPDGRRLILHIADHGSRNSVDPQVILDLLADVRTSYLPLAVITSDEGDLTRANARAAFMRQAVAMLEPIVEGRRPQIDDVATINLLDFQNATAVAVQHQLNVVMSEALEGLSHVREGIMGGELGGSSREVVDLASSVIDLDAQWVRELGLDQPEDLIVQASTGYAPRFVHDRGGRRIEVDWTYTVSLEPDQADFLRQSFQSMCLNAGSADRRERFHLVISQLTEVFSGDVMDSDADTLAAMGDLGTLPGAEGSFVAQPRQILEEWTRSNNPTVIEQLRRDVCWTAYHLGNMNARLYARPDQLVWTGREFTMRSGQEATPRVYRYQPVIGMDTYYLPSFFFVLPSVIETESTQPGGCQQLFCD